VIFKDALSGVRIQPNVSRDKDRHNSRSSVLYMKHVQSEIARLQESPSDWEALLTQCTDDGMYEAGGEVFRAAKNKGIRLSEDFDRNLFARAVGYYEYDLAGEVLLELVPLSKDLKLISSNSVLEVISEKFRRNDISYLSRLLILILQHNRLDIASLLQNVQVESFRLLWSLFYELTFVAMCR
jgi:hypothetical protein